MTKLLCFGDLHLGAGSQYGRNPGDRLLDQVHVLEQIATLAFDRNVDGVLFAGDAFEGPGVPPEQLQAFAAFVAALRALEIPVLAITGNGKHDAAVRDTNGMAIFAHIPGITVESSTDVHTFAGCTVATLPWVHPGRLIAKLGRDVPRDDVNTAVADLLVEVARGLRDDCARVAPDAPSVLLAHWSISGTALPAGLPVADLREPVIAVEALEEVGFDHIVAGHIHRPQRVGSTGFYTGSPLPLNFGEEHVGHGVAILRVGEREEIDFPGAEYIEIDSPRFITAGVAIDDTLGSSLDCDEDITDAIVRVQFTATAEQIRRIDIPQMRAALIAEGARVVKVEPTIVREQRARAVMDEQVGELAALDQWLDATSYAGDRDLLRSRAALYLETS